MKTNPSSPELNDVWNQLNDSYSSKQRRLESSHSSSQVVDYVSILRKARGSLIESFKKVESLPELDKVKSDYDNFLSRVKELMVDNIFIEPDIHLMTILVEDVFKEVLGEQIHRHIPGTERDGWIELFKCSVINGERIVDRRVTFVTIGKVYEDMPLAKISITTSIKLLKFEDEALSLVLQRLMDWSTVLSEGKLPQVTAKSFNVVAKAINRIDNQILQEQLKEIQSKLSLPNQSKLSLSNQSKLSLSNQSKLSLPAQSKLSMSESERYYINLLFNRSLRNSR